jgi:hypothetical protein
VPNRPRAACPICRASASSTWIDEREVFLVDCDECTTFTITKERWTAFEDAWHVSDREILMYLEAVSRYLRRANDDADREVTIASWMLFAIEGQHLNDERDEDDDTE